MAACEMAKKENDAMKSESGSENENENRRWQTGRK